MVDDDMAAVAVWWFLVWVVSVLTALTFGAMVGVAVAGPWVMAGGGALVGLLVGVMAGASGAWR